MSLNARLQVQEAHPEHFEPCPACEGKGKCALCLGTGLASRAGAANHRAERAERDDEFIEDTA